eukprot:2037129-Alexandrium_andersonii.AAC.1
MLPKDVLPGLGLVQPLKISAQVLEMFEIFNEYDTRKAFRVLECIARETVQQTLTFLVTGIHHVRGAGIDVPSAVLFLSEPERGTEAYQGGLVVANNKEAFPAQSIAIPSRYKVECILNAWLLRSMLSSGKTPLCQVIEQSAKLSLRRPFAEEVAASMRDGSLQVPSRETMRVAEYKLNLVDLLYQRAGHATMSYSRHWFADSSPQGKYNFYVVMEDRLAVSYTHLRAHETSAHL